MVDASVEDWEIPVAQDTAEVSFTVAATTLDAWWRDLPTKIKADLFSARMALLLEKGEVAG